MSARAIREHDGKLILSQQVASLSGGLKVARIAIETKSPIQGQPETIPATLQGSHDTIVASDLSEQDVRKQLEGHFLRAESQHPWLLTTKLVAKPDQLIKRRGKGGLLCLDCTWPQVKEWIAERAGKEITVDGVSGILRNFIIEPFIPHQAQEEFYVCIQSNRDYDEILFCNQGGVDVGNVDEKALRLQIPTGESASVASIQSSLTKALKEEARIAVSQFILELFQVFVDCNFTYLEINPLVYAGGRIHVLDLAAKLDQTAEFECGKKWSAAVGSDAIEFPAPFGRDLTREEQYIAELDAKTGASLKLTILNKDGRIWTMVAGGGASVAYSDAIASHGFAHELANYGEYSGAPSETQTYEYSKTILDLMTRSKHKDGKILFIGGGIANFTNVAATFKGIIRALKEYSHRLVAHNVSIYVRRGGPNYQEGLNLMRELGDNLGVPIHVFGPEMHITGIVPLALKDGCVQSARQKTRSVEGFSILDQFYGSPSSTSLSLANDKPVAAAKTASLPSNDTPTLSEVDRAYKGIFSRSTCAFVYGMQPRAVQGMLDFDFICKRDKPSVSAMIYPFSGNHVQKFYWGNKEILIPVFARVDEACQQFPAVDTVVNFASFRSVYETSVDTMNNAQIKSLAIIAEGVPERRSRLLLKLAKERGVTIIGPATVGGIKAGCFKIGNTGGMIDNLISCKLYRPGSVAYVSKSGGMSNELNNIISRVTDGVYEGVAIGGDRYPGTTFMDHLLRYEADPAVKMSVLLGEVGGVEEYAVCEAIRDGRLKKPIIAWCIGACSTMFATEVQFGHAGACAGSDKETAAAKNKALAEASAHVPATFEDLPECIELVYNQLVKDGTIIPAPEPETPKVPIDYSWAQELGLIRKPAQFVSTICDDRGQELLYAGMPISSVFKEEIGIGGVVSLLWFKRRLPDYACHFIEMVLMLTADHGPAVSGAHNTIVTARAGKDLVSSLASGLLTIGDRFGGALDGAAEQFSSAFDQGLSPADFVESMRKQHRLILGIGHKIKSRTNPDLRVSILIDFARKHFPACTLLDYALRVEDITTAKKDSLILNVDGAVGVLFVDLLRNCGAFSREEADEYIRIGTLNGIFVLGRSIGFIGHYLDQRRLKQGLYRHPWDDISYLSPN